MSKRTGEMITLGEVIDEIGADATRYFLVMRSVDTMLDFDLELAKQKSNDNPVYYVQYAHARICSILRQEELQKMSGNPIVTTLEKTERALLLKLIKFPEEIESTATSYGIHRLPTYATELASLFHAFYHECRVITEDKQLTLRRVAIIKSMQIILKTIFDLLAVSAPEKM
jgi:arginyl-tRNA synthetase